jgi:hypothetical protein
LFGQARVWRELSRASPHERASVGNLLLIDLQGFDVSAGQKGLPITERKPETFRPAACDNASLAKPLLT